MSDKQAFDNVEQLNCRENFSHLEQDFLNLACRYHLDSLYNGIFFNFLNFRGLFFGCLLLCNIIF